MASGGFEKKRVERKQGLATGAHDRAFKMFSSKKK